MLVLSSEIIVDIRWEPCRKGPLGIRESQAERYGSGLISIVET